MFRIVLDAKGLAGRARVAASRTSLAVVALLAGVAALLSLAAPASALANDCPAGSELRECLQAGAYGPLAVLGLLGAALGAIGVALGGGALLAGAAADAVKQTDREMENDRIFRDIDKSIARRSQRPSKSPPKNRR